ncbi:xanthine dehydrogenase family protein molybdopterin-binding subunit [Amycolatopsis sp. 195334CR]|uniref:xanthine dehydrogenase family protein molybdopterin-binding subunit n=1 Tax=Amycolatopsis sp. 195334CR TaxID=2814588 RepID=UPI001A8CC6E5|nr:molybdopterin cofactor-binding domain-containing protein [Amycolatopsis sp. 195334CR]MBN6037770.1 xanthine dehydrogenase family protein molybdopterin-binding subunit [Amycolatopsis sp. 195334CR]
MISRRGFLISSGVAALVVAVPLRGNASEAEFAPNVHVRITAGGRIVVTVPRPDTGQGVRTVVLLLAAEELCTRPRELELEQAPGDTARYGNQLVANSLSVRQLFEPVRTAAATARCLLIAAAARRWQVAPEQCRARDGFVEHPRHGRLSFGELAAEAAALDPATVPVSLIPEPQWRFLGKENGRADAADIVGGRAGFGIDVREPDALVAVVRRPDWLGAVVASVDDTAARGVAGVVDVVPLPADRGMQGGVAVVAESTAAALAGRAALKVEWSGGTPEADSRQWLADLASAVPEPPAAPGPVGLDLTYRLPMLAHAPMEPLNATAFFEAGGRLVVRVPTQDPGGLRDLLARVLQLDPALVSVLPTLAGGAFGRRFEIDFVLEAVTCARAAGRPVKVLWTRDDDMRHDSYRPMSVHRLTAVLARNGEPRWRSHSVATWPLTTVPAFNNPEIVLASGDHFPYRISGKPTVALRPAPLRTGFWRSVYAGQFVFAEECFLAAAGHRAGLDQVDLRRRLLPANSRLRKVLDEAARRAPRRPGRGRGVACHEDYESAIAIVADVEPGADSPRVTRVTAAVDVGTALHPSGVRAQVEGGVIDAMSTVFGAQITVREGRVTQSSFADYPWARIDQVPEIDVTIVPSGLPPGGLGELAYPPAAAAIASAVAAMTGTPITGLPALDETG